VSEKRRKEREKKIRKREKKRVYIKKGSVKGRE
jgi:hypothetical protein